MTSFEWIAAIGGGLVAPFVCVFLFGCVLPRMHVITRSIALKQKPPSIWNSIACFERLPGWWPPCVMIERLPDRDGHEVYRQTFMNGRRLQSIDVEVVESIRDVCLETRITGLRKPRRRGWRYQLSSSDGGSEVTIMEFAEIPNPFLRALFRMMINKNQLCDSYLICLGRKFGEHVQPS